MPNTQKKYIQTLSNIEQQMANELGINFSFSLLENDSFGAQLHIFAVKGI